MKKSSRGQSYQIVVGCEIWSLSPRLRLLSAPELSAPGPQGWPVGQTHREGSCRLQGRVKPRGGEEKPAIWLWGKLPMDRTFKMFGLKK